MRLKHSSALLVLCLFGYAAVGYAQAPLGPGKPGQKKLPATQPTSQPSVPPKAPTSQPAPTKTTPKPTPKPDPPQLATNPPQPETMPQTGTPESSPTTKPKPKPGLKKPQPLVRAAGSYAQILPDAAATGATFDLFFRHKVFRLAGRVDASRLDGVGGPEEIAFGAGVVGLAYPGRITPFIEAYAGGGFWHQDLFSQGLFSKTRALGVEGGAELYVSNALFLFGTVGYAEISREVPRFDGGLTRERFGGTALRFGLGVTRSAR